MFRGRKICIGGDVEDVNEMKRDVMVYPFNIIVPQNYDGGIIYTSCQYINQLINQSIN